MFEPWSVSAKGVTVVRRGDLSELVTEAARQDARDRTIEELGEGVDIPEREVQRWLKKLGASTRP